LSWQGSERLARRATEDLRNGLLGLPLWLVSGSVLPVRRALYPLSGATPGLDGGRLSATGQGNKGSCRLRRGSQWAGLLVAAALAASCGVSGDRLASLVQVEKEKEMALVPVLSQLSSTAGVLSICHQPHCLLQPLHAESAHIICMCDSSARRNNLLTATVLPTFPRSLI
jgi:hypothetical protein